MWFMYQQKYARLENGSSGVLKKTRLTLCRKVEWKHIETDLRGIRKKQGKIKTVPISCKKSKRWFGGD